MPTPTYIPLANVTLGSSASSVTFSSIPQGYRDLFITAETSFPTSSSRTVSLQVPGASISTVWMLGDGISNLSGIANTFFAGQSETENSRIFSQWTIFDYSQTSKFKPGLSRGSNALHRVVATACSIQTTGAITSFSIHEFANNASFPAGSTFNLYGIAG